MSAAFGIRQWCFLLCDRWGRTSVSPFFVEYARDFPLLVGEEMYIPEHDIGALVVEKIGN